MPSGTWREGVSCLGLAGGFGGRERGQCTGTVLGIPEEDSSGSHRQGWPKCPHHREPRGQHFPLTVPASRGHSELSRPTRWSQSMAVSLASSGRRPEPMPSWSSGQRHLRPLVPADPVAALHRGWSPHQSPRRENSWFPWVFSPPPVGFLSELWGAECTLGVLGLGGRRCESLNCCVSSPLLPTSQGPSQPCSQTHQKCM